MIETYQRNPVNQVAPGQRDLPPAPDTVGNAFQALDECLSRQSVLVMKVQEILGTCAPTMGSAGPKPTEVGMSLADDICQRIRSYCAQVDRLSQDVQAVVEQVERFR